MRLAWRQNNLAALHWAADNRNANYSNSSIRTSKGRLSTRRRVRSQARSSPVRGHAKGVEFDIWTKLPARCPFFLQQKTPPSHWSVFPFLHANSPAKSINKRIRQICGDRLPVLTSHEIGGHGCVSALFEAGLTPRAIAELVGRDEGTTSHYGNTTEQAKIETLDRVFGENCTHFAI